MLMASSFFNQSIYPTILSDLIIIGIKQKEQVMYEVFTRTWWRKADPAVWPNGKEPHMGRKRHLKTVRTEEEARQYCREWNAENPAGKLSRRAEYDRV